MGRLDIVVSNAGIASYGAVDEVTERAWQDMIDVQLTGMWHVVKASVAHLPAAGGGAIIITSSAATLTTSENLVHYTSAKHGVVGLMRTAALELAKDSIRVNSVHPTMVDTPMVNNEATYRLSRPDLEHPTQEDLEAVGKAMNALPIPWVEAVDISNPVLFLASDEARYITG